MPKSSKYIRTGSPRGRPPLQKLRDESIQSTIDAVLNAGEGRPRPRGRPPLRKPNDKSIQNTIDAVLYAGEGKPRPRGRPPLRKPNYQSIQNTIDTVLNAGEGKPRPRGRPPLRKPNYQSIQNTIDAVLYAGEGKPRPRGRPPLRKPNYQSIQNTIDTVLNAEAGRPRPRGRPPLRKLSDESVDSINDSVLNAGGPWPRQRSRQLLQNSSSESIQNAKCLLNAAAGRPRLRGRPPLQKSSSESIQNAKYVLNAGAGRPRLRGRPPLRKSSDQSMQNTIEEVLNAVVAMETSDIVSEFCSPQEDAKPTATNELEEIQLFQEYDSRSDHSSMNDDDNTNTTSEEEIRKDSAVASKLATDEDKVVPEKVIEIEPKKEKPSVMKITFPFFGSSIIRKIAEIAAGKPVGCPKFSDSNESLIPATRMIKCAETAVPELPAIRKHGDHPLCDEPIWDNEVEGLLEAQPGHPIPVTELLVSVIDIREKTGFQNPSKPSTSSEANRYHHSTKPCSLKLDKLNPAEYGDKMKKSLTPNRTKLVPERNPSSRIMSKDTRTRYNNKNGFFKQADK